jgi:hypothetical protein
MSEKEARLVPGIATLRKKPTAKPEVATVDKKAIEKSIFIEQIEMWGSKWNRFEDCRGWIWTQEESVEKAL